MSSVTIFIIFKMYPFNVENNLGLLASTTSKPPSDIGMFPELFIV